jgi:tRNA/tmRNA/rRNA uracil-C5-methylase (TrmA/RlmC/RlmD family)
METKPPFAYHDEVELEITTLTNLGSGLGRIDGWVIMVPFTLPGERVKARIYRNRPNCSEADLIEVIQPSPQRITPTCPLFTTCGGCQYQHLDYAEQLRWKRQHVVDAIERIGGLNAKVEETQGSPRAYGYRSKLTPHYQRPHEGRVDPVGFLRQGNRHRLVDVPHCPIAMDSINEALPEVRDDLNRKASAGKLKRGGTLLLRAHSGGVATVTDEVIEEVIAGLRFRFKAGDFFQNNPFILEELISYVRACLVERPTRWLVDTYCGSGLFSLALANQVEASLGIEISESSIAWARKNAKLNGIENARFLSGDAGQLFSEVDFPAPETTVLLDPPRKGCDEIFLEQLFRFRPRQIVYVSCEPATQARDLKVMQAEGYQILHLKPFDLFPQTRHVESVAVLELRAQGLS